MESNNPDDPQIAMSIANDVYFEQGYASTAIFLLDIVEYGKTTLEKTATFILRCFVSECIWRLL